MWRNPYARPDARRALQTASVWFTAYPISLITRPQESFLGAIGLVRERVVAAASRRISDEMDVRKSAVDPEAALRGANGRFEWRFRFIEQALRADGHSPEGCSLDELEALWATAKRAERDEPGCA